MICGHDSFHGDAVVSEPGNGALDEGGAGGALLVVERFDVGGPGVVINGDMNEVVSEALGAVWLG